MPTRPETLQFLLDQLASLPGVRVSKTFGEYCLYVDGRSVGFVCNDQLFLKPPTPAAPCWASRCWARPTTGCRRRTT